MRRRRVRVSRSAAALAVVALLVGACGGDDGGTEVLGISVERGEEPGGAPTSQPSPAPTTPAQPAPTEPDPEPEPTAPTAAPADPPPSLQPPASPSPEPPPPPPPSPEPSPEPSPDPSPEPEPYTLGDGAGTAYSRWTPHTEPADECCWIELDGTPPATRDGWSAGHALRGRLADREPPADGRPGWQQPVRSATCDGWLQAPSDRSMRAAGTATIEVLRGEAVVASTSQRVDALLGPGERLMLPRPAATTVDAADGAPVSCHVVFAR